MPFNKSNASAGHGTKTKSRMKEDRAFLFSDSCCDSGRNTPYTGGLPFEKQIRQQSFGTQHQRVLFLRPQTLLMTAE